MMTLVISKPGSIAKSRECKDVHCYCQSGLGKIESLASWECGAAILSESGMVTCLGADCFWRVDMHLKNIGTDLCHECTCFTGEELEELQGQELRPVQSF